jgi:uncharacterized lipoprotein NlpE involved in copper resistance
MLLYKPVMFRVPNRIRLAIFGSLCQKTQSDSVLQQWCCCLAAVSIANTEGNAKYAERISATISPDDVTDDYSTGDETEITWSSDKVTRKVQRMLRRVIFAAQKWTVLTVDYTGKVEASGVRGKKVLHTLEGSRGGVLVKALRYKPASRGFDSRWCHWNFSVT